MGRELKTRPVFGVLLFLIAAPIVVSSTRRNETTEESSAIEIVHEVNFDDDIASDEDDTGTGGAWAWLRAVAAGPWLALLLPLLVGLGLLHATLFHAAAFHAVASLQAQRGWRGWRVTAAGALGAACGAQVLLLAGMVLVALRVHRAMHDAAFASASGFGAFFPGHEVWQPLQPFLWATPVLIMCYWVMLTILCKVEEKKKRRKEEQKEQLEKGTPDISIIKITTF